MTLAGGTIKGITVEIGGNTGPLNKALGDVDKTSRGLQNELRQVEKLLKLDPTNTELLAQKQKLLAESVDNTSNKLNALKEVEKQVQEQVKQGKISEEQYRAFQREIIKTETELNELKSQASNTSTEVKTLGTNIEKTGESTNDLSNKVAVGTEAVAKLGLAAGAAAVGLGVKALNSANDFTGAVNNIITQTGLADDETTKFSDTLKNIYANNFGESYEDIASAMSSINQQTGLTGESLETTTTNAIMLRDTFKFEVNESIRSAQMLVKQFGLDSETAYNLIAQGAQNGLDKNGDLLDTVNEYSVQFKQLGFNAEEMFNMLANGAAAGTWSVDKLGDAVKEFGVRAKDGSETTTKAFSDLGLDVEKVSSDFATGGEKGKAAFELVTSKLLEMKDPLVQNQIGVSLFGTMWEDLGAKGIEALTSTEGKIHSTTDALAKINEIQYDTPLEALKGLGRTIETDVIVPIGEKLMPKMKEVIAKLQSPEAKEAISNISEMVSKLISFILDNSASIISAIAGIGAGFIAWNVASMVMGVVEAIKAFKAANEGATIAQWAINAAQSANPIGIIVMLIAGLVTAIITLWHTNEGFRDAIIGIWDKIKSAVSTAVEKVKSIFNKVIEFIKGNWQALLLMIVNPFTGAFKLLYDNCDGFKNFVDGFINDVVKFFKGLPGKVWNAIIGIKDKFNNLKSELINWANNNLPSFIAKFVGFMLELPNKMVNIGKNIVEGIWNGMTGAVGWLKDKISGFVGGIVDTIKDKLSIHSPSRVLADEVGKYMAQGIGVGFEAEMGSVSSNMAKAIPVNKHDYIMGNNSSSSGTGHSGDYNQTVNIYSPTPLTPSEVARQTRNASRRLVLGV